MDGVVGPWVYFWDVTLLGRGAKSIWGWFLERVVLADGIACLALFVWTGRFVIIEITQ